MAIADYLNKLIELKNQLVANLNSMGVTADENEKLNTLVPKVLECKTEQNVEFVEGTDFTGTSSKAGFITAISKINIPDGITVIGSYAFYDCESLASITIPDSVTSIGRSAFASCSRLKSITIPNSVTSIGINAFGNCSSLESITIPNSVTSIESDAFYNCSRLKSITIPDSVTFIGSSAFEGCKILKNIYYTGNQVQWASITKGANWNSNMGANVGGTVITYNYTG